MGFTSQAEAVFHDWRGTSSTNWFTSNNWSPTSVPNQFDDVRISTLVPTSFRWPSMNVFGSTAVRSVTVQGPNTTVAANLTLAGGQLTVLNDFQVGVPGSGQGIVVLQQASATLSVGGQIVVDSGSILDNNFGLVSQLNSQPILINGLYRQTINSNARLNANTVEVDGGSFIHSKGVVTIINSLAINGGINASYSLQGTGNLEVPVIHIGGGGAGTLILMDTAQLTATDTINVLSSGLFDIRKDYDFAGTLTLDNTTVKVDDGTTAKTLTLSQIGLLRGRGTVDGNLINDANVDPGLGFVGAFTLTGDYQQTAQGDFSVDLSGTSLSTYDSLDVTGDVVLGGVLDAQLVSGFMPVEGDRFDIISFDGSLAGIFSNVALPTLTSGISVALIYDTNAVTLAVGLDGDLNLDGFVGIADLNVVLGNWNQIVAKSVWLSGDPSGDGFVGIEDLNKVLGNWNAGTPPSASVSVPEPAGIVWFCLGGVGVLMSARRIRPSSN